MSLTAQGFIGTGSVQFAPIVAGVAQSYGPKRQTGKFEIKVDSDIKELISKATETYGQVIETVIVPKATTLNVSLRQMDYENLLLALQGSAGADTNQAAATVVDEVAVMHLGRYTTLAHRNLTAAGLTVAHSTGTPVYVQGTDYEVNYFSGQIMALAGGAITEAQSVKAGYTALALTGKNILGNTQKGMRVRVLFTGTNIADDTKHIFTGWEVALTPTSAIDLLEDKFSELVLKGTLKTPVGKTSPFELELI